MTFIKNFLSKKIFFVVKKIMIKKIRNLKISIMIFENFNCIFNDRKFSDFEIFDQYFFDDENYFFDQKCLMKIIDFFFANRKRISPSFHFSGRGYLGYNVM